MKEMKERIAQRAKEIGVTQADIVRAGFASKGTVNKWFNGSAKPNGENLYQLAEFLRTTDKWLVTGKESAVNESTQHPYLNDVVPWQTLEDLPPEEYIPVPRYDVHVSAGNGASLVWDEIEKEQPNAFRVSFFQQLGIKPENTKTIYAKGDSMEPRIFCGDSLTIDVSQTNIINDKTYVIRIEDEIFVKMLRKRPGGGLEIISRNPNYETMRLTPEEAQHIDIIGRVMHVSSIGGL